MPSLDVLGRDLLTVPRWRRAISLVNPFVLAMAFFVFAAGEWWMASIVSAMLMTFFTYGSISHDLVHRNLRLPRHLNEILLSLIELIALRSGHAYRVSHLTHHAHFPADHDLEGAAAGMTWWRALLDGVTLQPRLWMRAWSAGRERQWLAGEAIGIAALLGGSLAVVPWSIAPLVYVSLMIAGSWTFPLVTSFIPHDRHGDSELTRTRLFRGRLLSLVALEHLYHLEHHLYPQVPHHNWPELARRLDPYFVQHGLRPVRLLF